MYGGYHFLAMAKKNKGNFVKQKKQGAQGKKIRESSQIKSDKYKSVGKKTVKKNFDLPIVNEVHSNWLKRKIGESDLQETKMIINQKEHTQKLNKSRKKTDKTELAPIKIKPHKYEIVEYEIIEPIETETIEKS